MYTGVTGSFTYGADGLRRSASANGVTTHYVLDGQNVVQEATGTNRVTTLWGPRGPEARIAPDGTALWYVYDAHGNVLGEVDASGVLNPDSSGNPTAARVFDPWGYVLNWQQVADNGNPLKYCGSLGHPSENATGLIYMRARYYDPALGRFISEDPAKDGGNWYAYAGNSPITLRDASGRCTGSEAEQEEVVAIQGDMRAAEGATPSVQDLTTSLNKVWNRWQEQLLDTFESRADWQRRYDLFKQSYRPKLGGGSLQHDLSNGNVFKQVNDTYELIMNILFDVY